MKQVPSYKISQYFKKRSKYCVIIPVINEGERIQTQLSRMEEISQKFDVIIADGGSSDGSLDDSFLIGMHVRVKLVKTGSGKLSAQMRMALDYAVTEGYEGYIFIDGNNKDNPNAINDFAEKLAHGYDHVQGSGFLSGGVLRNTPLSRYWAIKLIHAPLISIAARYRYTDTTNGFRAYSSKFILNSGVQPFRDVFSRYELHYYLAIRAAQLGFNVIEIPVERIYPSSGKPPTKISGFSGQWLVMKTLLKACFGAFDPKEGV